MIHPRTLILIDKLCEMTRQKKIAWQLGEDDRIIHDTEGYRVILTNHPEELILTDPLGRELEKADEQELAETMDDDGKPYTAAVHELIRNASRIAKGTEFAIEKVLASLDLDGDGIPDLPPPPGIEELAAAENIASDDLIEDTTEETAPFVEDATSLAENAAETTSEVTGDSDADITDAVAKMADGMDSAPEAVSEPAKPASSMGGFGAFAAGASILGGSIASTTLGGGETDIETKTQEDAPSDPDPELTADAMQLADLQAAGHEDFSEPADTIIEDAAELASDIRSDLAGSGNTPDIIPDIIDDNVAQATLDTENDLSSQEQTIANMVESLTGTDEQSTAPASPVEPETPKLFTLSGIAKRSGIAGAAEAAADTLGGAKEAADDAIANTGEAIGEAVQGAGETLSDAADTATDMAGASVDKVSDTLGNIGESAGDAKEVLAEKVEDASQSAHKIIDDLAEPDIELSNSNGDAKPKPSTRFNPWK